MPQKIYHQTYQPSTLTTSGFFLKRRSKHKAAFFLTSGLQLLESWSKGQKSQSLTFSISTDYSLFLLQVTFEHQVPETRQILALQYYQPVSKKLMRRDQLWTFGSTTNVPCNSKSQKCSRYGKKKAIFICELATIYSTNSHPT